MNDQSQAIVGFRETERRHWNAANAKVVKRLQETSFDTERYKLLPYVHVLDLSAEGHIKPHVDSARFCGDVVAVLSLLSDCVARFVVEMDQSQKVDCLVPRRSLYVMRDSARYDFTHENLDNDVSDQLVARGRRVSVVCRCEPDAKAAPKH